MKLHRLFTVFAGILFYLTMQASQADTIKLTNRSGNIIAADFLQGSRDSNPILLLHGFLQTREFSTISRLAAELNDSGYTVLSPTLSLGINNRKQSLACEAIHLHSMDSDTDELRQWIDWLNMKSGKKTFLIGHSAGGPVILNYLEKYQLTKINYATLISLSYYASGPSASETKEHAVKAREYISHGIKKLDTYALNYCKTYPAFPQDFLSYYNWDTAKVSHTVGKFKDNVSIIIGTGDKRIDNNWRRQLNERYNNVISIDGANHFFDQAFEFSLTESIEKILSEHNR